MSNHCLEWYKWVLHLLHGRRRLYRVHGRAVYRSRMTARCTRGNTDLLYQGMHDKIFHFFKFHGNFEIYQDPFFEIFHEIFNFHYKLT